MKISRRLHSCTSYNIQTCVFALFLTMSTSTIGWIFLLCTDCVHFGCMKHPKDVQLGKRCLTTTPPVPSRFFFNMWWWLDVNGNLLQRWPDICFRLVNYSYVVYADAQEEPPPIIILTLPEATCSPLKFRPTLPQKQLNHLPSPLIFSCENQ